MFRSIRHKLIAITFLAIIGCASLVLLLAIGEHETLYRQSVEQNLAALSANLTDDLLPILSDDVDMFALTTELLRLDRYEYIKFANVYGTDWNLIHQYVHPNYLELEGFQPTISSLPVNDLPLGISVISEGLVAMNRIGEPDFPIGHLLVAQDYERPLNDSKLSLFFRAAPLTVASALLAILGSFWIYRRLLAPLLQLSKFTRQVEETGDYSLKIALNGRDEVTQLSKDFNSLLDAVDAKTKLNQAHTRILLQQQETMQRLANYDTLTGLPNRTFFMELLQVELARSQRLGEDLAIMFFDVDGFKDINDRLGHTAGDKLLKRVSEIVKSCLRDGDILARFGGDEFLIMVPGLENSLIAINIAERVIKKFNDPIEVDGWSIHTGVSIGIAKAQEINFDLNLFIRNADIAMYASKEEGKGRYTVFDKNILQKSQRKVQIANLISRAIETEELTIHYQLKISSSGDIDGLEALVRWHNKELGFISPAEFIPIAEQGGKIRIITEWVISRVFNDMRVLESMCGERFTVSLNVSSYDLRDCTLIHYINKQLDAFKASIAHVQFEITESSYLVDLDNANEFFTAIHDMGGSIALDDFGTGYSSLSYLTKIQIDTLKIDREFVTSLQTSKRDIVVLQTILDLGRRIGLNICCEGVETAEQARYLISHGCDYMQGYYFAKPVPLRDLPAAIVNARTQFTQL